MVMPRENPPPIWHTEGMNESHAYFYEFAARCSHEPILPLSVSHLSVACEEDDETYNHSLSVRNRSTEE